MPARDLIVDASVARAAGGEEATYPTSKNCRDFLRAFLGSPHRTVMSPPINEEWNKHQSSFARTWLVSIIARKRVRRIAPSERQDLREHLLSVAAHQKACDAMLKDVHLLEAALVTDKTVIALDEVVRGLFRGTTQTIGELRPIIWINPDKAEEEPILWLEEGAEAEKRRMLGYNASA